MTAGQATGDTRPCPATLQSRVERAAPYLAAWLALFAIGLLAGVRLSPGAFTGLYEGTDPYTRLLRVREWLTGGAWWNDAIPRSNAPHGEVLHWTRPLDVLIAIPTLLFEPVVGLARALEMAAVLVPPALLGGVGAAGAAMARGMNPKVPVLLAALAVGLQPYVLGYALPGRVDHHVLILLVALAAAALLVRSVDDPSDRLPAWAGSVAAVGLWVSVESVVYWALAVGCLGVAWLVSGSTHRARHARTFAVTTATAATAFLFVERPPSEWWSTDLDQISATYVVLLWGAAAFWGMVVSLKPWPDRGARLAAALGAAALTAVAASLVNPQFLRGPFAEVEPALAEVWLRHVEELQSHNWPHDREGLRAFTSNLAMPLLVLTCSSLHAATRRRWPVLAVCLAGWAYLGLSLHEIRWTLYVEATAGVLFAPIFAWLYRESAAQRHRGLIRLRPFAAAGALATFAFSGPAVGSLLHSDGAVRNDESRRAGSLACDPVDALARVAESPDQSLVVLAHVDRGPRILYQTPHRVLATPYHRNPGTLAAARALNGTDFRKPPAVVRDRNVDLILLCPEADAGFFTDFRERRRTLFGTLRAGTVPPWLEPIQGLSNDVKIFRVRDELARTKR